MPHPPIRLPISAMAPMAISAHTPARQNKSSYIRDSNKGMRSLNRTYTILSHVSFWLVLVFCIFQWRPTHGMPQTTLTNEQVIATVIPFIVLFYVHAFWL